MTRVVPPEEWITSTLLGLIVVIINFTLLKKEWNKRKSKEAHFTNKQLQFSSLIMMICGVIAGLVFATSNLNGFCSFGYFSIFFIAYFQGFALEWYQLARLYYCFSRNKVYSNKGYPTWIFVLIMVAFILNCIAMFIASIFTIDLTQYCGVRKDWNSIEHNNALENDIAPIFIIGFAIAHFLDFVTLLLYIYKVASFEKYKSDNDDGVHKRIMSILLRVTICTLLYQIAAYFLYLPSAVLFYQYSNREILWIRLSLWISLFLWMITLNYSMYLMQTHNTKEYHAFLWCLVRIRILNICYCCKDVVQNEAKMAMDDEDKLAQSIDDHQRKIDDTVYDTRDLSIDTYMKKIEINPMELSVETTAN